MSNDTTQHTPADVRERVAADADEIWYHWIEGQEDLAIAALRKASDEELARFLGMLADWQRCPMPSDHDMAAALRSESQGELVKEAVALIDEAVSEIVGDCQCYEEGESNG